MKRPANLLPSSPYHCPDGMRPDQSGTEEQAYRRGYQQGARAVLEAIEDGAGTAMVRDWVAVTVKSWRYRDVYKLERPPETPMITRLSPKVPR